MSWKYEMSWVKPKPYNAATYEPQCKPLSYHEPERHKTYTIEQLRIMNRLRHEAGNEGVILPALPCPFKVCMACEGYRAYWDKKFIEETPHNQNLFQ